MSNDDWLDSADKTQFQPLSPNSPAPGASPPPGADQTLLKPTPGMPGMAPATGQFPPISPLQAPQPSAELVHFQVRLGLNPLVNAANTLLGILNKLRNTAAHQDIRGLFHHLVNEIKQFDSQAKLEHGRPQIVLAARYVLCTALDEAVLSTPWGIESNWSQKSLLITFHNEASGGEKFFQILDRMLQSPRDNQPMLELLYLVLSFGYLGRYRMDAQGREKTEQIRESLFQTLSALRPEAARELSSQWKSDVRVKSGLTEYFPMWVVALVFAALMLLVYVGFSVWLNSSTEDLYQELRVYQLNPEPDTATEDSFPLLQDP